MRSCVCHKTARVVGSGAVAHRLWRLRIAAALATLVTVAAYAQADAPRFTERPGILEFSGQMIVRPVQPAALRERGLSSSGIEAIRVAAAARLTKHVVEYVPQTDEYVVRLPPGRTENSFAAELMTTGDYEYAVPNWICHPTATIPNDGGYGQQWHHPQVRSSLAWDITTGDPSVIIAIVDGGIELDHPDLADALVPGYNAADRIAQQDGGEVGDVDGHGTFVSGLAGAIGNNGTHVVGMGWNFSIMPVRYYNSPGGGFLSDVLDGARWAVENGAKCINVSQTGVEYAAVQTTGAYVKSQGGLLFWAAGNDGRDLSWFDWGDVIVVGGTDPDDNRTFCSAYGLAVDLYAPGIDILSTGVPGALAIAGCGTSSSTPMAAGIGALVWTVEPLLTPDQVEAHLFSGCVDLGMPGNDTTWGWGRVDAYGAVLGASTYVRGDMNCDTFVDSDDVPLFVEALLDPAAFDLAHPICDSSQADMDGSDTPDGNDIQEFVGFLMSG